MDFKLTYKRIYWIPLVLFAQILISVKQVSAHHCSKLILSIVPVPNQESIELYGTTNVFFPQTVKGRIYGHLLLSEALKLDLNKMRRILVIGTGIGYDAIVLAKNTDAKIDAIDINAEAVELTAKNAELHGLTSQIKPILGNLFQGATGKYDLIIFNAPRPVFKNKYLKDYVNYFKKTNPDRTETEINAELAFLTDEAEKQYNYYIKENPDLFDPEGDLFFKYMREFKEYLSSAGVFLLMTEEHLPTTLPKYIEHNLLTIGDWGLGVDNFGIHKFKIKN